MQNQKSDLSIPPEWRERFIIKRIGEEDIQISLNSRNEILKALNEGSRFIQIGKYTLMLNSIKSIDPYWQPNNIPPRPKIRNVHLGISEITGQMMIEDNKEDVKKAELWDKLFNRNKISVNSKIISLKNL